MSPERERNAEYNHAKSDREERAERPRQAREGREDGQYADKYQYASAGHGSSILPPAFL